MQSILHFYLLPAAYLLSFLQLPHLMPVVCLALVFECVVTNAIVKYLYFSCLCGPSLWSKALHRNASAERGGGGGKGIDP